MIPHRFKVTAVAAACLGGLCCAAASGAYRFEDPAVLDISIYDKLAPLAKGEALLPVPLDAAAAAAILKAKEIENDGPGQLPLLDGPDKAARKQEAPRIAADAAAVQRSGKTLTIKPQSGAAVLFTDKPPPRHANSDADGELFVYAGRLGAAPYHRVEERFEQDAPASYLVNAANGKTIFVPNGSYIVQPSPDGQWLLSTSTGDTHLMLAVMSLDADGPGLALLCHGGGDGKAGPALFKGWHDATSFDLVLTPSVPGQQNASESIPVRFTLQGRQWRPATPDPKVFARLDYACKQ